MMKKYAVIGAILLSACSVAPVPQAPSVVVPRSTAWWTQFGSPSLVALIQQTLANNNDLHAAAARIDAARALATGAGAALWPNVSLNGSGDRALSSAHAGSNAYKVGAQMAYEIDLFGKLSDTAQAAAAQATASAFDFDALALSLAAQTATAYINVQTLDQRLGIARNNLRNAQQVLTITQQRYNAGVLSALELAQQQTLTYNQQAALQTLQQQRAVAQNLLAVLVGATPAQFTASMPQTLAVPVVATVLPAHMLARRPDIARLEAQLRAANFNIAAARAAFYPSISLTASSALALAPSPVAVLSSLAAAVQMPLFNGWQLSSDLAHASAQQQELAANYRQAVLNAYAEAQNALYAVQTTQERRNNLAAAAQAAAVAYAAAQTRFAAGAIDYQTLLNTQTALLQAQDTLAQATADRLIASIDVYKALGGGD